MPRHQTHSVQFVAGSPAGLAAAHGIAEPAISGAERDAAIERLITRSTRREGLDWDLLSRLDAEAWETSDEA